MCKCKNITMGSYDACITLTNPFTEGIIGVDECVLDEVKNLWSKGIETVESCCGHNITSGYIAVREKHITEMINLGYYFDFRSKYWDKGIFKTKTKGTEYWK